MEANARASSLWRDVRNTFNLLSSRKQQEERHWNQPCNFYSVIIPVTTSDRADINSHLSYFFLLFFVFFLLQPPKSVADANTYARCRTFTESVCLNLRPGSGKPHAMDWENLIWAKTLVSWFMAGDRETQALREGVLLSISIFILLPVGMCTCTVPAVLCVLLLPRTWSPLCPSDSLGESQGLREVG